MKKGFLELVETEQKNLKNDDVHSVSYEKEIFLDTYNLSIQETNLLNQSIDKVFFELDNLSNTNELVNLLNKNNFSVENSLIHKKIDYKNQINFQSVGNHAYNQNISKIDQEPLFLQWKTYMYMYDYFANNNLMSAFNPYRGQIKIDDLNVYTQLLNFQSTLSEYKKSRRI